MKCWPACVSRTCLARPASSPERKLTETQRLLAGGSDYLEQKGSKPSAVQRKLIEESMAQAKASGEARKLLSANWLCVSAGSRLENALAKDEAEHPSAECAVGDEPHS
ncbi:hypothetical protein [Stenotrophomonas phage CM2]